MTVPPQPAASATATVHLPSLTLASLIMVFGTVYPPLFANAQGHADHGLAMALFWAMSAGFVRGVGFLPRLALWRWMFSSWAAFAALATALAIKLHH